MPHYDSYHSFQTKRSMEQKKRAKEKSFRSKKHLPRDFIILQAKEYGIVIEVRYHDASILYGGQVVLAKLRFDMNFACNQILLPGDKVVLNEVHNKYYVQNLIKRSTILSRLKKDRTKLEDVGMVKNIAANIDVALLVVSAKEPPLHAKFIDRYLLVLQNSKIPTILCLNKCEQKTSYEDTVLDVYRNLGIPVVETSTYERTGIDTLKQYLLGKQAIFVGNSGVGKSSLINVLMDEEEAKTSHVGEKSKRGRHTTTTSKYYVWDTNSSVIDTPGIRSLDVSSFSANEIQDYFPEFHEWKKSCKYRDCLHYNEPYSDCMVKQQVVNGNINQDRYESYVKMIRDYFGDHQ